MDSEDTFALKLSCIGCLGTIILSVVLWAMFIYGIILIIDAVKG